MSLFLQILGVMFLLIVAYVAFRVLLLVGKALILYGVKKLVSQVEASAPSPTIHLVPIFEARWDNADALAAGLPGLGYEEVGFFDLDIMWDTINVESLRAVLADWDGLPERDRLDNFLGHDREADDEDDGDFGHVRRSFAELNAGVPVDRRLLKIGEVAMEPIGGQSQTADVYERPATTTMQGLACPAPS